MMNTSTTQSPITTWTLDPAHSTVGFKVRHLMITNVHGEFQRVSGTVAYDPSRPRETKIDVEIPATSVSTRRGAA